MSRRFFRSTRRVRFPPLTLSSRHLFSLMEPRHPRKPVTMTTLPSVMMRLAAESDGKEGDKVAKLP